MERFRKWLAAPRLFVICLSLALFSLVAWLLDLWGRLQMLPDLVAVAWAILSHPAFLLLVVLGLHFLTYYPQVRLAARRIVMLVPHFAKDERKRVLGERLAEGWQLRQRGRHCGLAGEPLAWWHREYKDWGDRTEASIRAVMSDGDAEAFYHIAHSQPASDTKDYDPPGLDMLIRFCDVLAEYIARD